MLPTPTGPRPERTRPNVHGKSDRCPRPARKRAAKPQLRTASAPASQARKLAEMPLGDVPAARGSDPENLGLAYGLAVSEARAHSRELLALVGAIYGGARWPPASRP